MSSFFDFVSLFIESSTKINGFSFIQLSTSIFYYEVPDSLCLLLWSKFYPILLLLGLQFLTEYVSYAWCIRVSPRFCRVCCFRVFSSYLSNTVCFWSIDFRARLRKTILPCQGTRLYQVGSICLIAIAKTITSPLIVLLFDFTRTVFLHVCGEFTSDYGRGS